jgi:hypothetical protein
LLASSVGERSDQPNSVLPDAADEQRELSRRFCVVARTEQLSSAARIVSLDGTGRSSNSKIAAIRKVDRLPDRLIALRPVRRRTPHSRFS